MRTIEKEADTTEEAFEKALLELGARRDEVEMEVLQEASRGIFGIGSRKAKVKITLKSGVSAPSAASRSSEGMLEEAGKATGKILDMMGIEHSMKTLETDSAVQVDLKVEESQGLLIGKYGETLRNLEYVVSRIVSVKTGQQSGQGKRVSIDINDYKREREKEIERKAVEAAKKVVGSGRPFTFHRMQAYERKVVYTAVRNMKGIKFETKEDGNAKKITFLPVGEGKDNRK